jgi:hypothetical protein
MLFKKSKRAQRIVRAIHVVLGVFLLYVASYGIILTYCVHFNSGWKNVSTDGWKNARTFMRVYRPLACVAPESWMRRYTQICGLSKVEAFVFVKAMRTGSNVPSDVRVDPEVLEGL